MRLPESSTDMRCISAYWGMGGILLMLAYAIYRLYPKSIAAFDFPFAWYHWLALGLNIGFMAYSEGYKGFQMNFSPRVAARARYLCRYANPLQGTLAPLFCMGYFHAPRRRRVAVILLTIMIIILIIIFQRFPQPWRGILDAGVVVGLAWGMVATVICAIKALSSQAFTHDPEVPGYEAGQT